MRIPQLLISLCLVILIYTHSAGQKKSLARPKLVVGIIVDQMRYDYLYKYYDKYSNGGFKKLIAGGFNCRNTQFNYAPTYTGPGHASIYTGTTPAQHGIIGNEWYVRNTADYIYVTDDPNATTIGSSNPKVGKMSPANLVVTTVTDELRQASSKQSKVIGIALKDRGAILPAGHLANAAYWFDTVSGYWVTSSYYMQQLPEWMNKFNARQLPQKYLSQTWNTLLSIDQYTESAADDNPFENKYPGESKPVFPHEISKMWKPGNYNVLRETPFGNALSKDLTLAAIEGEQLGKGPHTDFITISFSSTDYVGHKMGPHSIEMQDTYLRLDQDLSELITYLENAFKKNELLIFLTSDHGVTPVPAQLKDQRILAGYSNKRAMLDSLKTYLNTTYGSGDWMSAYINQQVYLNHMLIAHKKIPLKDIQEQTAFFLLKFPGVANTYTASQMDGNLLKLPESLLQNGFNKQRSGDVSILLQPGWIEQYKTSNVTTHGTPYRYDTHVPLLWYGWRIRKGSSAASVDIIDIAPTLSDMLNISQPDAATGKIITEMITK